MSLYLNLLIVTIVVALAFCAPTENYTESTLSLNKAVPGTLYNKHDDHSKESEESKEVSTTHKSYQFGSRPVRDVPHFISGVPTPTSTQSPIQQNPQLPQTQERQVRDTDNTKVQVPTSHPSATKHTQLNGPEPPKATNYKTTRDVPHFISGVPTPTSTQTPFNHNQHHQQSSENRQVRDTHIGTKSTEKTTKSDEKKIPAPPSHTSLQGHFKPQTTPHAGDRHVRNTKTSSTTAQNQHDLVRPAPRPTKVNPQTTNAKHNTH